MELLNLLNFSFNKMRKKKCEKYFFKLDPKVEKIIKKMNKEFDNYLENEVKNRVKNTYYNFLHNLNCSPDEKQKKQIDDWINENYILLIGG